MSIPWLVSLLLLAHWSIDLALWGYLHQLDEASPDEISMPVIGYVFGQLSVISAVLVWGRVNIVARSGLAGLWLAGLAWVGSTSEKTAASKWFGGLLILCGLTLVPLIAAHLAGWRLGDVVSSLPAARAAAKDQQHTNRHRRITRYTVWGLLSLTFVVAITLAAAKQADFPFQAMRDNWFDFTLVVLASIICASVVLFPRRNWVGHAVVLVFLVMTLLATGRTIGSLAWLNQSLVAQSLVVPSVCGVTVSLSALVLRVAGVGFIRRTS